VLRSKLLRLAFTSRPEQCRLFGADDRIILRLFIDVEPREILFWYGHVRENGLDRAFRYARVAIDTGIRIYEQPIGRLVKGLYWANRCAVGILTLYAGLGYDISHLILGILLFRVNEKCKLKP
jgi:hypothetical protein